MGDREIMELFTKNRTQKEHVLHTCGDWGDRGAFGCVGLVLSRKACLEVEIWKSLAVNHDQNEYDDPVGRTELCREALGQNPEESKPIKERQRQEATGETEEAATAGAGRTGAWASVW